MHSLAAAATLGLFGVVTAITTPPLGAVTVGGGKGSHEYSSIQKAVDSGATSIFIYAGTYKEQVSISSTNGPLTIYGYSANDTTYTSNEVTILHSAAASGGQPSDPSATLRSHSKSFNLYNVNIVNSHGAGNRAVALSAYGDQQGYYGCQVKGYQGTLLAEANHQIFVNTYVEGAKEFVFGKRAGVWFEQCDIGVLSAKSGAITASGRDSASNPSWVVFSNSHVSAAPGNTVATGAYYLGKPWAEYARVVFQNSYLSPVINAAGWRTWVNTDPRIGHVTLEESGNSGPGSVGTRAKFARKIAEPVIRNTVLGEDYQNWIDTDYLTGGGPSTPDRKIRLAREFKG